MTHQPIDLMAALQASVTEANRVREEAAEREQAHAQRTRTPLNTCGTCHKGIYQGEDYQTIAVAPGFSVVRHYFHTACLENIA